MIEAQQLQLLFELGPYRDAEQYAHECLRHSPDWSEGHSQLARSLLGQDERWNAYQAALKAVAADPEDAYAHAVLVAVNFMRRQFGDAMNNVCEAIRLQPDCNWVYSLAAAIENTRENHHQSIAWCEQGLRHDPNSENLLYLLGTSFVKLNQLKDAQPVIERGLKLHPNSASLWHLKAQMLWKRAFDKVWPDLQLRKRADVAYREAIRLDPANSDYQENYRHNQLSHRILVLSPVLLLAAFLLLVLRGLCPRTVTLSDDPFHRLLVDFCACTFLASLMWCFAMIATTFRDNAFLAVPLG